MLQVFHGRQGPSKPWEGKADRDKRHVGGDRYGKQCKKSLRGEGGGLERNRLIYKLVYRLIESVQANRKYRGRI
jgi:hypothetical protein